MNTNKNTNGKNEMMFALNEKGFGMLEFMIILGIFALIVYKLIILGWTKVSASSCGVFEFDCK